MIRTVIDDLQAISIGKPGQMGNCNDVNCTSLGMNSKSSNYNNEIKVNSYQTIKLS